MTSTSSWAERATEKRHSGREERQLRKNTSASGRRGDLTTFNSMMLWEQGCHGGGAGGALDFSNPEFDCPLMLVRSRPDDDRKGNSDRRLEEGQLVMVSLSKSET